MYDIIMKKVTHPESFFVCGGKQHTDDGYSVAWRGGHCFPTALLIFF